MVTKVILDTNIWITYFFNGKTTDLAKLILDKKLDVFTTDKLIYELQDVLSRDKIKKKLGFPADIYLNLHKEITIHFTIQEIFNTCPDIHDNYLIDLAKQSNTKILITGDKKLLTFKTDFVQIISLTEFLAKYQ